MTLSRSSFYHRERWGNPEEMKPEADLRDCIEAICLEFPRYGYRRVTHQLRREGWLVNHKKVLRLMRESELLCRVKRKWVVLQASLSNKKNFSDIRKSNCFILPTAA